jgi:two-component system NtrC family sensor kinase
VLDEGTVFLNDRKMGELSGQLPAAGQPVIPNVLVVDDVQANLLTMEALLSDLGCNLVLARSGNEALRLLLRREFAVMMLDVQMPEMDGYEVAKHARDNKLTSEMPIIFVTATHDTEENVLRGYGTGAVDFLFKPVNATVLRSKVRVFLDLYNARRSIADSAAALARANTELKETQAQLVQSVKMAALGQLVAGIAHEINNPLAFAMSHVETIRRKVESLDQATNHSPSDLPSARSVALERLRDLGTGLERIRDLVLKLRTFSRLDEGERKFISVRESLEAILTIYRHRMGEGVRLVLEIGDPAEIECSPGLFNQAVANLISNALDAMEDKGVLTVEAGGDDGMYSIAVSDTGPGIPPAVRERVLEPFFTTKPVGQGTGLGLSIAYGIIRKHEGTVHVGDAPGGGARVTIRIPVVATAEGRG